MGTPDQQALHGMDVGAADQFSGKLSSSAGAVQGLLARTTALLGSVTWIGADAQRFHEDWHGSFVPQMTGAIQALHDNAQLIRTRAEAQRAASGS